MPRIDVDALEEEWDDDVPRRPSRSLSVRARERIEEHDVARVVAVDRGRVTVWDGTIREARYGGAVRGERVVVGDRVRVTGARHESDVPRVVEVLPRDTVLTRTGDDALEDERPVVANADQVVVVVAADHLTLGTRFLDRVLVAASAGGLASVVCVNRIDLVADLAEVETIVDRYAAIGIPSVRTSARTEEGVDDLAAVLAGVWSAFTGHSGVGKSSLFNLLVPEATRTVGEIGRYGGRHTTVSTRAMRVEALDAWLVDTPGVRSFGLGHVPPETLGRHFPELATLDCELDDCSHDGEPGCRLATAAIHPDRLASYRRLLAALRGEDPWVDDSDDADEDVDAAR